MGSVVRDLFTGAALLVCALVVAVILIPVLVILSVFLHMISWFLTASFSILLFAFVLWGIGFLYRKTREAGKTQKKSAAH